MGYSVNLRDADCAHALDAVAERANLMRPGLRPTAGGTHAEGFGRRGEPVTDLTARLEVLLRRYAADRDAQPPIAALDRLREDFRWELELLIVKYGQTAVDKAIDAMPDTWPSVSLH